MLLNFKKITMLFASISMIGGVILTASLSNGIENLRLNAEPEETHRRIYVWVENEMNKDEWGDGSIYIHYWGGTGSNWNTRPQMNEILAPGSFYRGLFYYDIPSDNTSFMITANNEATPPEWKQSDTVTLTSGNRFKSFKLINVYSGGSHEGRPNFYESSLIISANEFIQVVNKIDSCSDNYASGWNHYKDLIRLFIYDDDSFLSRIMTESEFNKLDTTTFFDVNYYSPFSLTENRNLSISIEDKIEALRIKYNVDNSTSFPSLSIA